MMKRPYRTTPIETFLQHRDYYDARLIELLEAQQMNIKKFKEMCRIQETVINSKKSTIKILKFKNKDLKAINTTLK